VATLQLEGCPTSHQSFSA